MIDYESSLPHTVSEVICVRCWRRWLAVRPEMTLLKDLECAGCGGVGAVIETGQDLWEDEEIFEDIVPS